MPTLALSMIVKDAERDLAECLASVRGITDEIVVADTGSSDASPEIARQAGARVISIAWENDFAKARNRSLAEVTADWVLMLDADERLDPGAGAALPALLANREVAGFQVTIRNYVPQITTKVWDRPARPNDSDYAPAREYPGYVDHENVRLFRRDPEVYFTGRVHETTGARILETGRRLGTANFLIHHMGMVRDAQTLARKLLFYRELGRQKVAETPEDAQAHLELGIVELDNLGNVKEALAYFERACQLKPSFGVAWFFAGKSQFLLGQFARALHSLQCAEAAGHATAGVAEYAGDSHYNLGNYEAAGACYRRGIKRAPSNALLESKLGLAEARTGHPSAGLRRLRRAVERDPANPEMHDRLITVEVWLNRLADAAEDAERKLAAVTPRPEDFLRAASIRARMEEWPKAAEILRQGLAAFPDSEALRGNLTQVETLSPSDSSQSAETATPVR